MTAAGKKNRQKRKYPMKLRPFGQRHRRARTRLRSQTTANKIHPMTDMTPSPLRVRKERSDLLPDGNSAPTTVAVAAAMAISPHTHSGDITRIGYDHSGSAASGFLHRRYLALLDARRGPRVPIAATAYWFLELITDLQEWVFTDLPNGLAPHMGVAASSPGSASAADAGERWMLLSLEHPDLDGDSYPSRPAGTHRRT